MSETEDLPGQDESDTRQRILQAAASVFGEKGYAGATTRSIAARAGVNEVTLFRHFGRKENLLTAVIDQHSRPRDLIAQLETRLTGDYRQDLEHIADLFVQVLTDRRQVIRLMLCEADQFPELRQALARNPGQLRQVLVDYLESRVKQKQLRTVPLEAMVQAFWGMLFSYAISSEMLEEPMLTDAPDRRLVPHLVDVFVSGTARSGVAPTESGPVEKTPEAVLTLRDATRRFRGLTAVKGLSFTVPRGEIFGLLGPSGAGKTTAIHLITGTLAPSSGDVRVLGRDPRGDARWVRQRIGLIPQENSVYLHLSALDNMWHHAALYVPDLSGVKERIRELLTRMALWEQRKDPVRTFSGGMKRRLALARTLLHDPEIVLFDEPGLGVDVQGKRVLWDHIRSLQSEGKTFVVATNDTAEADALCDRLAILDFGRAIALDTPGRLKEGLGGDIITVRSVPHISDPEKLLSGLGVDRISHSESGEILLEVRDAESVVSEIVTRVSRSHRLESILVSRPSLADVFLHYTGRALAE